MTLSLIDTHPAVARAIYAIADEFRSADEIWKDPFPTEWARVRALVREYVQRGDFPAEADNRYQWRQAHIIMARGDPP